MAMAEAECPLPLVEDALRPYMKTRQEVQHIRKNTTTYLALCSHATNHLDLLTPFSTEPTNYPADIPPTVYRKYLDALAAHHQAREKYNVLRTELDSLRDQKSKSDAEDQSPPARLAPSLQEHIDLISRRKTHQRLTIISGTLEKLHTSPSNPTHVDLKPHLRSQLGEPPDPLQVASIGIDQSSSTSAISTLVTNLKKSLILAHGSLQETEKSRSEVAELAKELADPGLDVRVQALRSTKDKLIQWVEGELARVPEDESVLEDEELDEYINGEQAQAVAAQVDAEVQSLYRCYADSRATLLRNVQSVREEAGQQRLERMKISNQTPTKQSSPRRVVNRTNSSQGGGDGVALHSSIQGADLLPFLPSLITASRNETALQLQTTYLRRQLIAANEETSKTIQRLAGESYLVPADSTSMTAWARAAADAGRKTEMVVTEHSNEGREALKSAADVLRRVKERRAAIDALKVIV